MSKWAIVAAGAMAASILLSDQGVAWERRSVEDTLLLADLTPLDSQDLGNQAARGIGLEPPLSLGLDGDPGVILWDELKQGLPPGPQPHSSATGQGRSTVSAVSR